MLDLGTSFLASVARDPAATAIVDGDVRLTYAAWLHAYRVRRWCAGRTGLRPGDHLLTVLQNRWEAATLHWACQLAGIIITPLNWRAKADELGFCLTDAEARAVVFEEVSAPAVRATQPRRRLPRIALTRCRSRTRLAFRNAAGASRRPTRRRAPMPTPGR